MTTIKNTIKTVLLGTAFVAVGALASCSCGSSPAPVEDTPVYVAPPVK